MSELPDISERLRARLGGPTPPADNVDTDSARPTDVQPDQQETAPAPSSALPEPAPVRVPSPEALARFEGFVEPVELVTQPVAHVPERRLSQILMGLAGVAVLLALLSSWVMPDGTSFLGRQVVVSSSSSSGATESAAPPLPKGPGKMLPDNVLAYETIDLHLVPGTDGQSSEAIYQTYNMNSIAMAATVVYARVDGYSSEAGARQAYEALIAKYPTQSSDVRLKEGITATVSYAKNRRVQVAAWQKGRYVTWVKTSFTNPANGVASVARSQALLEQIGGPLYRTVAIFQSRDLQGVQANTYLFGKSTADIPSSSLGPVDSTSGDTGK
ncbi:MAG: hypothetical protein CVT67_06430 [Actinobacteria bacterium HGW-Actinobacteria-7]|jgi:hypothetical protein|nr:MAG: hypothetical protein CVT67_06430 [Actinobacteria bacterium HGW-Actinobacteria-7]